jgi:uncharacterized iron-regulated membrane protein
VQPVVPLSSSAGSICGFRTWTWRQVRAVVWFKGGLSARARDFNWHNTIGLWSVVPLFVIVLSGVVMSYPWASDLVYRAAGEAPPAAAGGGGGPRGNPADRSSPAMPAGNFDALWARAVRQVDGWRSISLRLLLPARQRPSSRSIGARAASRRSARR